MLELQLVKGSLFENVLEAILDLVNVANIDFSSTGISLQAVDTQDAAILSLFLPSEHFQLYRCDEDRSMGIAIADMLMALRCARNDDIITIKADNESSYFNYIILTFESPKKNSTMTYRLQLVDAKSHRFKLPAWQNLDSKYPSAEFMCICKNLSNIGGDVAISVTEEEGVSFFASGKTGCGVDIVYRQNKTVM